jgi:hypothetical protein
MKDFAKLEGEYKEKGEELLLYITKGMRTNGGEIMLKNVNVELSELKNLK